MSIPKNITKPHLKKAIKEINENGIPKDRKSSKYDVVYEDVLYPPKLIISLANKYANGKELDPKSFNSGEGTPAFNLLRKKGFLITPKNWEKRNDIINLFFKEYRKTPNQKLQEEKDRILENQQFFDFFCRVNVLKKAKWSQFQKMKNHINAFSTTRIAGEKALGKPNHKIAHYREQFHQLIHGDKGQIGHNINNFIESVKFFNLSSTSEILGNAHPGDYMFYNETNKKACSILGIELGILSSDNAGQEFVKYNERLYNFKNQFRDSGSVFYHSGLPLNLELDIFFRFVVTNSNLAIKAFDNFVEVGRSFEEIVREKESSEETKRWWLNANPKQWNILDWKVGEKQSYTAINENGNKRRVYENFENVKPGDTLIGYQTKPYSQILAIFEITKGLHKTDTGEEITFELKYFLKDPISWSQLKSIPELEYCQVLKSNQGSLFQLEEDEFQTIKQLIDESSFIPKAKQLKYLKSDLVRDTGLKPSEIDNLIGQLFKRGGLIFQGPPGTGKSHVAEHIAKYLTGYPEENIEIVQFHPSYSYDDFVEGFRPDENGAITNSKGIFYDLCRKARTKSNQNFILIIDEINRGNLSSIFGELLYLLDKREKKIKLIYSKEVGFFIPKNVLILGTMNLSDRSLSMVDYALRRRFSFYNMEPNYKVLEKSISSISYKIDLKKLMRNLRELNKEISNEVSLGRDFQIGHSYFMNQTDEMHKTFDISLLNSIWNFQLEPLLAEYYFQEPESVNSLKNILFQDII